MYNLTTNILWLMVDKDSHMIIKFPDANTMLPLRKKNLSSPFLQFVTIQFKYYCSWQQELSSFKLITLKLRFKIGYLSKQMIFDCEKAAWVHWFQTKLVAFKRWFLILETFNSQISYYFQHLLPPLLLQTR